MRVPVSAKQRECREAFDAENHGKLLMKIAWTHACRQLGRDVLQNPVGNAVLRHIAGGYIPENDVVAACEEVGRGGVDALLRCSTVDGERMYWWKDPAEDAVAKTKRLGPGPAAQRLHAHAMGRLEAAKLSLEFNNWPRVITVSPEVWKGPAKYRYHQLTIEDESRGELAATVVHVVLFGGILDAKVQVTDRVVPHENVEAKRIEF